MAGFSLLLLATGAILRFGVSDRVEGVDLSVVGVILMIVGAVGFVASFAMTRRSVTERVVSSDGRHVVEEHRTSDL